LGKRANIVGVLTLSPGGSTITASIADEESQFIINRQVAALSRANPGVSLAFLFSQGHSSENVTNATTSETLR